MGPYLSKKTSIKLIMSSKQGKRLLFYIQLFWSKAMPVLNVSAKFEYDWIKDEEAALI